MRILIVLLFLSGCAKPNSSVDPELQQYLNGFSADYGTPVDNISALFDPDLPSNVAGLCDNVSDDREYPKTITINPKIWENYGNYTREHLMYHELGHCVFGLRHIDDSATIPGYGEVSGSILNRYIFDNGSYEDLRALYKKALPLNRIISHLDI